MTSSGASGGPCSLTHSAVDVAGHAGSQIMAPMHMLWLAMYGQDAPLTDLLKPPVLPPAAAWPWAAAGLVPANWFWPAAACPEPASLSPAAAACSIPDSLAAMDGGTPPACALPAPAGAACPGFCCCQARSSARAQASAALSGAAPTGSAYRLSSARGSLLCTLPLPAASSTGFSLKLPMLAMSSVPPTMSVPAEAQSGRSGWLAFIG